ncbi:hypothetical protein RFI_01401 [Reticulomyxa filosa]|uniref:Uncharacterized protein n=1 Tax=Reticulomyxa filosa TaxID=46433 RepID=X6PBV6_RETFI|nr:hypothetical protein RFI_01401 [Reticulomyxa filosa]|eukprot:ETO35661.1 hypothetical protein RFI_01401 [Reticulomyxa filosa]
MYFILFYYLISIAMLKHLLSVIIIITIHTGNKFHSSTKLLKIFTEHIRHALIVFLNTNHYMFSMNIKIVLNVWIFHHYKAIIIKVIKLVTYNSAICTKKRSNELINTILSGSWDSSVRLCDIRSGQQIQLFNEHKYFVTYVEYSLFIVNNIKAGSYSKVSTIRFWDIRSNKNESYVIEGNDEMTCFKFVSLKRKKKTTDVNLYYGCSDLISCLEMNKSNKVF